MPKKDFAQLALSIVQKASGAQGTTDSSTKGRAGGKARADSLTKEKRAAIAKTAAAARWKKS